MANSKIKILLRKIHSIIEDEDTISQLEMDLVKSYLRDLYELTDSLAQDQKKAVTRPPYEKSEQPVDSIEPTRVNPRVNPVREQRFDDVKKEMVAESAPIQSTGNVIDKPSNGRMETQPANHSSVFTKEPSITVVKEVPPVFEKEVNIPQKFQSLFELSKTTELSDKLSRSPISDLHRAFGINDRMLIVTDLFGGDQNAFNETIDILNSKYSFDEAKSYLIRYIIERFNWLDEQKVERARDFIKLAERRYMTL